MNWIPCSTLPDAEETVLVFCPEGSDPVWLGFFDGEDWREVSGEILNPTPTHWATMPDGPKGDSK